MNQRIIRLPQVRELVGLGKSAIYGKIKAVNFQNRSSLATSGWVESEVQAWINSQIVASRARQMVRRMRLDFASAFLALRLMDPVGPCRV
jgi:prophage regulatory protein